MERRMKNNALLWIGDHEREEFARIVRSLDEHASLLFAKSAAEALRRGQQQPFAICVAHARPGELNVNDLSALKSRWPQVPLVNILGEWCCGLKRTSKGLAEFAAVYSHELPRELDLPCLLTFATQVRTLRPFVANTAERLLVALYSPSKSYRRGLAEAFGMLDVKTIELSVSHSVSVTGVDFVVWDVAEEREHARSELAVIRERHPHAKILALMTFPREDEVARLLREGVQVIAQPFELSRLFSFFGRPVELSVTSAA